MEEDVIANVSDVEADFPRSKKTFQIENLASSQHPRLMIDA